MCLTRPIAFKKSEGVGYKVVFCPSDRPGFYPLYQVRTNLVPTMDISPIDLVIDHYGFEVPARTRIAILEKMGQWLTNPSPNEYITYSDSWSIHAINSAPIAKLGITSLKYVHDVVRPRYVAGFHIFSLYQDAKTYCDTNCGHARITAQKTNNKQIVLVKYRKASQWGVECSVHSPSMEVIVAQEMFVMKKVDK